MIQLNTQKKVTLFGKSREITEVDLKEVVINNDIKKVLAKVENKTENKAEVQYSTILTLWQGDDFDKADTTAKGIEKRIKELL